MRKVRDLLKRKRKQLKRGSKNNRKWQEHCQYLSRKKYSLRRNKNYIACKVGNRTVYRCLLAQN